jgi:lipid-A-disaccharide synthase
MSKKIFVIAGEHSGDTLGAGLLKALKEQSPVPLEIEGIGGPKMAEQGLKSLLPMEELCVMGLFEVVSQLPRLLKLINGVVEEIEKRKPDVVITIDLPDFNFEVARRLKKRGNSKARIIHYVAPSVWAWRPGRAKKVAGFLDGLICLFPFEPEYFTKHKLKAVCVGHPLVESNISEVNRQSFRQAHNLSPDAKVLGLFFGSRESELKMMNHVFRETTDVLHEQYPDFHVVVPTMPHLEYEVLKAVENWDIDTIVVTKPEFKWEAFAACDVGLAVSGTVGLELAYMGIPHVIGYKLHPVTGLILKLMLKIKYAHLGNILLDKMVVPEFLQHKCTVLNLSKSVLRLLKFEEARVEQIKEFASLRHALGADDAKTPSAKAAAFVLSALK